MADQDKPLSIVDSQPLPLSIVSSQPLSDSPETQERKALPPPPAAPPPPPIRLPPQLGGPAPADPNASILSNYLRGADIHETTGGALPGWMESVLDLPRKGIGEITSGVEQIAGAGQPAARGEAPTTPGRQIAGGASKIIRGTGETIAPVALPAALVAAPVATVVGLGTGAALGFGGETIANALGLPPEYSALLGDTLNLVGGAVGPKALGALVTRMKINPTGAVAELVKFADDHGIPLSAAARTGMDRIRKWQAATATSKAAQRSQAATGQAMESTAESLRGPRPQPPPPGGPAATREGAATGVVQSLRTRAAEHAAGESAAYGRLEEIQAANEREVQTGVNRVDTGLLDDRGRPLMREEPVTEKIGLPVDLKPAKARLEPLLQVIEKQLPPALREQSVGLQGIRNLLDAPDTVSATQADGYLSAVKSLLRERNVNPKSRRLLHEALDAVSPAVDQAVAQAGPEATQALADGRALTAAKYAVQRTMRLLRVPKEDEFPLEPLRIFRKFTAPGDVNIGLLERVQQQVPNSMPAVGRAWLEGLFDSALGRNGKLDPMAALKAWNRAGDRTKAILLQQPRRVTEVGNYLRAAARDDLIGRLFDLALGRQGKQPDPAAALREWNRIDDGTKRMLLESPEIPKIGLFLRLAEHEARTPRATAASAPGLAERILNKTMLAIPEIGALVHHPKPALGATFAYFGFRMGKAGFTRALATALWNPSAARILTRGIRVGTGGAAAGAAAAGSARGLLAPDDQSPAGAPAAAPPSGERSAPSGEPRAEAAEIPRLLAKASRQWGVPLDMLTRVASRETGGLKNRAAAKSPKGALGVMQIMPATAAGYRVEESDLTDLATNIDLGARILRDLLNRYHGDQKLALAAYNAGPGAVRKYHGVPPYQETQQYVSGAR